MLYVTVGLSYIFIIIAAAINDFFSSVEETPLPSLIDKSLPKDDADVRSKECRKIAYFVGTVIAVVICGGVLVYWLENWSVVASLYWAFQTTTTVGYGDEPLQHTWAKFTVALYSIVSVATVARAFGGIAAAVEEARSECHRRDLLRRLHHLFGACKANGGSMDRTKFLTSTLVAMNCVSEETCEMLLRRFDEIDFIRSGTISRSLIKRASLDNLLRSC
jgi:hypothetical protein